MCRLWVGIVKFVAIFRGVRTREQGVGFALCELRQRAGYRRTKRARPLSLATYGTSICFVFTLSTHAVFLRTASVGHAGSARFHREGGSSSRRGRRRGEAPGRADIAGGEGAGNPTQISIYLSSANHDQRRPRAVFTSIHPMISSRALGLVLFNASQPFTHVFRPFLRQVNIRDAGGNSPLHIACEHGHVHIVKTLIVYNANSGSE